MTDELLSLIAEIESDGGPESEYAIGQRIAEVKKEISASRTLTPEEEDQFQAEIMAFEFMGHEDEDSNNYFRPFIVSHDNDGELVERPSIRLVTPKLVKYWEKRSKVSKHPVMAARYADLVWDIGRDKVAKPHESAQRAIDSYIQVSTQGLCRFPTKTQAVLRRAFHVAQSINDEDRVGAVVEEILDLEDRTADDSKPGTWGFAFDTLLDRKKPPVNSGQEQKIIAQLTERLERLAQDPSGETLHAIKCAVTRLAKYYRRRDERRNEESVLREYASSVLLVADQVMPLRAFGWLQEAHELLSSHGLRNSTDDIERKLRAISPEIGKFMSKHSATAEIPQQEIDDWLDHLIPTDFSKALCGIALHFLPDPDKAKKDVLDASQDFCHYRLLRRRRLNDQGIPVAEIGTVDEDLDGHVVDRISESMAQVDSVFLRLAFQRFFETFPITVNKIVDYLLASPLFRDDRRQLLGRAVQAYFDRDRVVAITLFIPEIETSIRQLLKINGGSVLRPGRHGGFKTRSLDNMLKDPAVSHALQENGATYLRILLTDQRGWNLRNLVCHGMLPVDGFVQECADRLFHVLLYLALFRIEDSGDEGHE